MQQGSCANLPHQQIQGTVVISQCPDRLGPGKWVSVQIYSTQVDFDTNTGKLSEIALLRKGKSNELNDTNTITYGITFQVDRDFGIPGALLVTNLHKHEFFLVSVMLKIPGKRDIHFDCNSWVYPIHKTKMNRVFFSNTCYLPERTPIALRELREEELINLRGDGRGERKEWERIYDYDNYNDLGNHGKARIVLGGTMRTPYPWRGRTGQPPTSEDVLMEGRPTIINLDIYIPPDERFSPSKMSEFLSNSIQAIEHFLIPETKALSQQDSGFESFDQLHDMFSGSAALDNWMEVKLKNLVSDKVYREIVRASKLRESCMKFPLPQIMAVNQSAWKDDEEFAREMIAGTNPAVICRLETFPPESISGKSSITAAHIEKNLDGSTLQSAMDEWRIFILNHHDYLMPSLRTINAEGVCIYASRTLLFLRDDGTLKPVAIELSLPSSEDNEEGEISRVFVPGNQGTEGALWQLAKAHVVVNDSCYHQLISHWLHTHAVVEPFIIATRRQLSSMHPIHRLLDPHFKDTMHINALARSILLGADGIIERTMYPGKYSMALSCVLYKYWRFDEQGLPADLVKRRLAVVDSDHPSGVRLLFEDYPYGADGLDIWTTIKTWVSDYCSIYYTDDATVSSDIEIQAWWNEIRQVGHGDKRNEGWWYQMNTLSNLTQTLTTLMWIASALHASVNFGQYGYAGYPLNRPTTCRKFIPEEGTLEFAEFLEDPDKYYLKMLPDRFATTLGVALIEVLSTHMSDEVYLGQRSSPEWTDNDDVRKIFEKFRNNLKEVEKVIMERNGNPKLKNRLGPARIPYTLLFPDTSKVGPTKGITGKGIPNSVSI
ncbi:linoleate 9S-lipoxygenase A-like [Magnolia sinica]|uniref:linoleate 9S-lipoxygenase A-like n=1 Tax=Magnolia sinica TaxID=86752 RepID=UPI002659FDA7|nr:linoleate 9S-lipoxygenase A-like [Magnolia sinica]